MASGDPSLRVRGLTLSRWILAARLSADAAVRAASSAPRTLAGLAARHAALASAAPRLGFASPRALLDAIHGHLPAQPFATATTERPHTASNLASHAPRADAPAATRASQTGAAAERARLPSAEEIVAALAAAHGLETAGIEWRLGAPASETVTVAPGHARVMIGEAVDGLAALGLALHEAGHALYRAQQQGMSMLAAAPPARWFDEAIAAWAVRALEDPAFVRDAAVRDLARARRVQREALTETLAVFEEAIGGVEAIEAAWARTGLRDPAAYPALFDEPGVMASYAAADRARLEPRPGELRRWARAGAGLALAGLRSTDGTAPPDGTAPTG